MKVDLGAKVEDEHFQEGKYIGVPDFWRSLR
jgi:hypothetical protein